MLENETVFIPFFCTHYRQRPPMQAPHGRPGQKGRRGIPVHFLPTFAPSPLNTAPYGQPPPRRLQRPRSSPRNQHRPLPHLRRRRPAAARKVRGGRHPRGRHRARVRVPRLRRPPHCHQPAAPGPGELLRRPHREGPRPGRRLPGVGPGKRPAPALPQPAARPAHRRAGVCVRVPRRGKRPAGGLHQMEAVSEPRRPSRASPATRCACWWPTKPSWATPSS